MTDLVPLRRALLSVSDKTGLVAFATVLASYGIELLSTGGTAKVLRTAGLSVKDVSEQTGFPEMMDGRVKTLHPIVHGGLLALRDNEEHLAAMDLYGIGSIDLVVVNLYPFEQTVAKGAEYSEVIENIDIGGPAMIRSAAKNHRFVNVLVDVADYEVLLTEMSENDGCTSYATRQKFAQNAYSHTAAYDTAVSTWMASQVGETPRRFNFGGTLVQSLRYGENPHQSAAFYKEGTARPGIATATQHQGKELSYNNINDTDAAFELISEFKSTSPVCAIIKHANPCGVAIGDTLKEAYTKAFDCDRTSAFGGIIAFNKELDEETAWEMTEILTEVVIAPAATVAAREVFKGKKNLRLLTTGSLADPSIEATVFKQVSGGFLVQDKDVSRITLADLKVVTRRKPSEQELADLFFAWTVAKHIKSNAIVYVNNGATVGVGAGQMSRVDSTRIAVRKAQDMATALNLPRPLTHGSVVASDAFFPFADGLISAADAGATALIQPGGSLRDKEVIAAADEAGLAMVFTGMRHFRH